MSERKKIIEAMARAMCQEFYGAEWDDTSQFRRDICMKLATAAIRNLGDK